MTLHNKALLLRAVDYLRAHPNEHDQDSFLLAEFWEDDYQDMRKMCALGAVCVLSGQVPVTIRKNHYLGYTHTVLRIEWERVADKLGTGGPVDTALKVLGSDDDEDFHALAKIWCMWDNEAALKALEALAR